MENIKKINEYSEEVKAIKKFCRDHSMKGFRLSKNSSKEDVVNALQYLSFMKHELNYGPLMDFYEDILNN